MQSLWTLCALIAGAVVELALGRLGFAVPVLCMTAFHFFIFRHWLPELFGAWILGAFLDAAFARPWPQHLVVLLIVLALARVWRECQMTYMMLFQAIPGAILGGAVAAALRIFAMLGYAGLGGMDVLGLLLAALKGACAGAIWLPLEVWILDRLSGRLGLARYTRIGGEGLSASQAAEMEDLADDIS